jgi:hypothetical protein
MADEYNTYDWYETKQQKFGEIMDPFLIICFIVAMLGGIVSGINNLSNDRTTHHSKNIFTFFFCDRY